MASSVPPTEPQREWKELTAKEKKQAVTDLYGSPKGRKLVDTFQLRIDE